MKKLYSTTTVVHCVLLLCNVLLSVLGFSFPWLCYLTARNLSFVIFLFVIFIISLLFRCQGQPVSAVLCSFQVNIVSGKKPAHKIHVSHCKSFSSPLPLLSLPLLSLPLLSLPLLSLPLLSLFPSSLFPSSLPLLSLSTIFITWIAQLNLQ